MDVQWFGIIFAKFFHCYGLSLRQSSRTLAFLNSKHSWAIPTYVSNTTPPPWGLTLTGTSVEIVCRSVKWLTENVHLLVIIYKS